MVIAGLFSHLDSKVVPETAEVLRDLAAQGQQVVVFTRFEHVASCFRLLNVQVRYLDNLAGQDSELLPERPLEQPTPRRGWCRSLLRPAPGDAEEFPGELTDRVRLDQQSASLQRELPKASQSHTPAFVQAEFPSNSGQPDSPPENVPASFHLTESHLIEHAPSIDRANIDRLRKIGILRVGDLLRVSPAAVAAELRYAGITADMIANWHASPARLSCAGPALTTLESW